MDYRHPEPVVVGDFVKTVLDEGPYRLESISTVLTCELAWMRAANGQRRWFPIKVLRRVTPTAAEEAQWLIDQLQH